MGNRPCALVTGASGGLGAERDWSLVALKEAGLTVGHIWHLTGMTLGIIPRLAGAERKPRPLFILGL